MAAMAAVFIVMLVLVQIAFLVVARQSAMATVDATLRDAASSSADVEHHRAVLRERIEQGVPGVDVERVTVETGGDRVAAVVTMRWTPPGPDLAPVVITVSRERTIVVPP